MIIGPNVEDQFICAGPEGAFGQDRAVGPAVAIGRQVFGHADQINFAITGLGLFLLLTLG